MGNAYFGGVFTEAGNNEYNSLLFEQVFFDFLLVDLVSEWVSV